MRRPTMNRYGVRYSFRFPTRSPSLEVTRSASAYLASEAFEPTTFGGHGKRERHQVHRAILLFKESHSEQANSLLPKHCESPVGGQIHSRKLPGLSLNRR